MLETKSLSTKNTFDTVIHNAHIYRGDATEPIHGMLGICGDRIAYAGQSIPHQTAKSVDAKGNLTIGVREHIVFPEIDIQEVEKIHGMEVVVNTNAKSKEEGFELLRLLGFPFRTN